MTDSCIHEDYSAVPMSAATTEARVNCSDVSIATGVDEHCVASIYFAHNETRILLTDRSSLTNKIYQGSMIQLEDISIIYCNLYSVVSWCIERFDSNRSLLICSHFCFFYVFFCFPLIEGACTHRKPQDTNL